MVVQLCAYARKHRILHFKWVNCMVCELNLNKAFVKKLKETMAIIEI